MIDSTTRNLYMESHGSGDTTIVFVPGLGGTTRYWRDSIGPLAVNHRIVLLDLLGFGLSPKPWTRYTVERHVAEMHKALRRYKHVTLVGHSLGALLTVAYAAKHTTQVKAIALIGMPYFGTEEAAYRHLRSGSVKWGLVYTNVILAMITCILTRRVFGWLLPRILTDIPRAVAEDLVMHTWRSSTSSLWEVVYRYDAAPDLRSFNESLPVLMIHGREDDVAPFAAIQKLAEERPNWRLEALDGVDHHPYLRNPLLCLSHIQTLIPGEIE